MPDTPEIVVTGDSWNSFNELDLMFPGYFNPGFYGDSAPTVVPVDAGSGGSDAFAPPVPELLPEFVVEPPKVPVPVAVPVPGPSITAVIGAGLTGLVALLFPQPLGPAAYDEAPTPPQKPPQPPGATDPLAPPDWWDMAQGGDESLLDPIIPPGLPVPLPEVEMPPGEKYFDVTPPIPTYNPFEVPLPFTWKPELQPIEVPLGLPGIELAPDVAPDPGPGPAPAPYSPPGINPLPGLPDLFPDVRRLPDPLPYDPTAPDVLSDPLPDLFGDPIGDPVATPRIPDTTRPDTRTPTAPGAPDFFADPGVPDTLTPELRDPLLTEFGPNPQKPDNETCSCAKKPKEKKKKRQPRAVCYKGTYQQRKNTTIFRPTAEVPCDAPPPKGAKKPRKRTPKWKDVLDEVFGFPAPQP